MFSYLNANETSTDSMGYAGDIGQIIMIIISLLGILINITFSVDYLKKIIKTKNRDNAGVSTVEKILCMIAIVETLISIFWLFNNILMNNSKANAGCKAIAYIEIFLYLFDWLILSTSLYQIKIFILNPQEIFESGKRVFKFIIGCAIVSLICLGLSIGAKIGGRSPMYTCFITFDGMKEAYKIALFWIICIVPLFCFGFGIYQVCLIRRSWQYKNDSSSRNFFIEYSYFVITYIISSILLILVYVVHYFVNKFAEKKEELGYKIFIGISTFLTCAAPLIVGIIRIYRTGLLKRICLFCKKRRANINIVEEQNGDQQQLIMDEDTEVNKLFDLEKIIVEKLIIKHFTAVSFALGKSKYKEEEVENDITNRNEKFFIDEKKEYKITREEILKDLDLSLNDDIKVLGEANIDIEVTEYNSSLFKKLRQLEGLNEDKIISMFQPKKWTNQLIHRKNESFFINSSNKLLMLKKIKREQMHFFQNNILPNLYDYFVNNPNSIICRIFGFYRIKIEQQEEKYMALIYNIQESIVSDELGFIEDKTLKMKATEAEFKSNLVIGLKSNEFSSLNATAGTMVNRTFEASTYKERKKKFFKLYLTEQENDKLDKIIKNDTDFLTSKNNNGYHFHVFEKEMIGNNLNLSSSDDLTNDTNKLDESNPSIKNEIKKYVFNSNKPNSIYCICISGI